MNILLVMIVTKKVKNVRISLQQLSIYVRAVQVPSLYTFQQDVGLLLFFFLYYFFNLILISDQILFPYFILIFSQSYIFYVTLNAFFLNFYCTLVKKKTLKKLKCRID